ncbi:MAG TPA: transcriptional regulator [Micromonosporaceae bacterium]|nr:transcriptional regulator [Micromonosporaceae bacterium]
MIEKLTRRLSRLGALAEPARRDLYLYVVSQPQPVGRDQAAADTGLPRHVVKFHLDRLVDEGLLEVEYRRLSGRRGPGAGRPAKLYRRAAGEISVSLPERHYELVGRIFAEAIRDNISNDTPIAAAVAGAAARAARRIAREAPADAPTVLSSCGYEPRTEGDRTVFANCPFDALAQHDRDLVCGMNREFVAALMDELGRTDVEARLDPQPPRCCVVVQPALT